MSKLNPLRQTVVDFVKAQVGKPYVFGAAGPYAYDCSGLVLAAWQQVGINFTHQSGVQAVESHAVPATAANRKKLLPGDLVFYYGSLGNPASITHVGVYVGRGRLGGYRVVAAVDEQYGVKNHRMSWALKPLAFGFVEHGSLQEAVE